MSAKSFVLLRVGGRRFALPAEEVVELAAPTRLHSFPHTTPLLVGVIVRRGRIVPVCDPNPVLGRSGLWSEKFYLVTRRRFGSAEEPFAIPVSGDCELASGAPMAPEEPSAPGVSGVLRVGEESTEILDLEKLLAAGAERVKATRPEERR